MIIGSELCLPMTLGTEREFIYYLFYFFILVLWFRIILILFVIEYILDSAIVSFVVFLNFILLACNGWLGLSEGEAYVRTDPAKKDNTSIAFNRFLYIKPTSYVYVLKTASTFGENSLKKEDKSQSQQAKLLKLSQENKWLRKRLNLAEQSNKKHQKMIGQLQLKVVQQSRYLSLQVPIKNQHTTSLLASSSEDLQDEIEVQPDLFESAVADSSVILLKTNAISGAVEFGFNYEHTNNITKNIYASLILDYNYNEIYSVHNDLKIEVESEDDEVSTEQYRWQLQGDYFLDKQNLLFLRTDLQRSKFSSYDQEDVYTIGYGRTLIETTKNLFKIELGPGYRMAVPNFGEDSVSIDEFIVRTRLNYERVISESLQVIVDTVLELGSENSTYALTFRAQNKVYRELYLNFDINYKYTENVPIETSNKEVSTGIKLMYAF
ncbi:DUF481 domain-containing protein [Psychromonas sp. CD1]|uniref:DUF481 domain-containing protein n=1 Tax=Psychromonas sp. CD1 TaxID=1979839 RepID=UPI000B9B4CF6|nr:DUF481 domain-containing protein [Psychromonas sp. CD1]